MSTFKQKKELNSQIAAAKKAGKSVQTIGKLQYKLNQLTANPKGNAVRSKSTTNKAGKTVKGSVVKTGTGGTVRTKPTSAVKKKRATVKVKAPTGHPSAGRRSTVTTTGLNGKSRNVAAGSGKVIPAIQSKIKNPHTGKTTAQLKVLAAQGDINAKNLLKVRASLPSAK